MDDKFRPGITVSEFPPITLLLSRKNHKAFNILVGDDPFQVRFAERVFNLPCLTVETITDSDILTGKPCLLRVTTGRVVDLSDGVKEKVSIWSIGPMKRGSAGASAIVRYAADLMGKELDRTVIQKIADAITQEGIEDIPIAIWNAVGILSGPTPGEYVRWLEPWESHRSWLRPEVDPGYRLHTLFKSLSAYAFIVNGEENSLKIAGIFISPSKIKYLKNLKLDLSKVYNTLRELSSWKIYRQDPYICAIRISAIWQ